MKIIKYLLLFILILFIAGSIYIATKSGEYHFEKGQFVPAPQELVFKEVREYSTWKSWSAWNLETQSALSRTENTSGPGAGFSWKGNDGNGKIETVEAIPYSSIEQKMLLENSISDIKTKVFWTFKPQEDGTLVHWGMKGKLNFKEKLALTLEGTNLEEEFGNQFSQSLKTLKTELIAQMEKYSIHIDGITQHGGGYYMYSTTATKIKEVNTKSAKMIQQVELYMKENNISINGSPFVIYNQRNAQNGNSIISAAVPTPSLVVTPSGSSILNEYLPQQKVIKTTLRGNYKNAAEAWKKTYNYIEENELEVDPEGEAFEVFITNTLEEQNPALWVTEIYIPIK